MKKKTVSEVFNIFNLNSDIDKFELLSCDGAKNLNIRCKKCNRTFLYKSLYNWIVGTKNPDCPYCGKNCKNLSVDIIQERLKDCDFKMLEPENYINTHKKILVKDLRCLEHGAFYTTYNHIQQGLRCPKCGNIKSKDCERLTLNDVQERISNVPLFLEKYEIDISNYKRYYDRNLFVKCKKCKTEFYTSLGHIVSGNGCPKCKESHIEKNSLAFLNNKGYTCKKHFRGFSDLRGKRNPLEIDIVIENTNIGNIYIELNGEFHYYFSDDIGDTEITINHDIKKIEYFKNKDKSTFIVIPFWEFSNIYKILDNIENLEKLKKEFNITIINNNNVLKELKQPNNKY